jgi:hypothetical protein
LSKVKDGKEKMGYMQAVEFVAREFGGNSDVISTAWNYKSNAKGDTSDETKEYIRKREWKKERSVNAMKFCSLIALFSQEVLTE